MKPNARTRRGQAGEQGGDPETGRQAERRQQRPCDWRPSTPAGKGNHSGAARRPMTTARTASRKAQGQAGGSRTTRRRASRRKPADPPQQPISTLTAAALASGGEPGGGVTTGNTRGRRRRQDGQWRYEDQRTNETQRGERPAGTAVLDRGCSSCGARKRGSDAPVERANRSGRSFVRRKRPHPGPRPETRTTGTRRTGTAETGTPHGNRRMPTDPQRPPRTDDTTNDHPQGLPPTSGANRHGRRTPVPGTRRTGGCRQDGRNRYDRTDGRTRTRRCAGTGTRTGTGTEHRERR